VSDYLRAHYPNHRRNACTDCGAVFPTHPPGYTGGSGYVDYADGARVCYPCGNVRQRVELAETRHFCAYLGRDARGPILTTWTGGILARCESVTERKGINFGGTSRFYFRAVAPDGSRWYGSGAGYGMYVHMHRAKR